MKTKYIKKMGEKYIFDYENPKIGKVELWDFSRANKNEESRKETICLVASISYGNEYCKNPDRLWNLLVNKGHESVFELIKRMDDKITGCVEDFRNERISFPFNRNAWDIEKNMQNIATFKLKVPIFVARQIMRHRSFSYIEMSRRYVKDDKVDFEFWCPNGNTTEVIYYNNIISEYHRRLKQGFKPEQARGCLPLETYTQFWMQGDYKALLNFFIHRLHPEAQEETRLAAQAMWDLLKKFQPEIIETITNYLESWVDECNPIFRPARDKKAKWFKENFLGGK